MRPFRNVRRRQQPINRVRHFSIELIAAFPLLREVSPALTAAEVLETLRLLPTARRSLQFDLLRSLVARCGKLEAYFLAKLVLQQLAKAKAIYAGLQ